MSFHEGLGVFRIHVSNTFTLRHSTSKRASSSIWSSCESFRPSVIPSWCHLDTERSSEERFWIVGVPEDKSDVFNYDLQVFQKIVKLLQNLTSSCFMQLLFFCGANSYWSKSFTVYSWKGFPLFLLWWYSLHATCDPSSPQAQQVCTCNLSIYNSKTINNSQSG